MIWILFTDEQRTAAIERNENMPVHVRPRLIDAEHDYKGYSVAPIGVITGEYAEYWADYLAGYPQITEDPDAMFIPSEV